MRKKLPKLLITGGAGFIGSTFTRLSLKRGYPVIMVDNLTYAGDLKRLGEVKGKFAFYKADICDKNVLEKVFLKEKPDSIINFAAHTHVDRSIRDSGPFMRTNIVGTQVLLDASRKHDIKRFIHISTDEIYGEIEKGKFTEDLPLKPNSPYAASKAAADLLIKSYIRTHAFPAIIVRPSNNYGPWQYPEKLIPFAVLKILRKEKIPVYGNGRNTREWLFVKDCAQGLISILEEGEAGQVYNLGSGQERQNIDVVKQLLKLLKADLNQMEFVKDRPGHDLRYSLDSKKLARQTGWRAKTVFEDGLKETVAWCLANKNWLLSKYDLIAPLYK